MRMPFRVLVAMLLVAAVQPAVAPAAAAICDPHDPVALALREAGVVRYTDEPDAGRWRTWTVEPADVRIPTPPAIATVQNTIELADVKAATLTRTPEQLASIERWGTAAVSAPWTEVLLEAIKTYSPQPVYNPPRIARAIAIFETAIHDALVATWNAKFCHLRPPPSALDPTILTVGEAAEAPSYPGEHGVVAGAASVVLSHFFPDAASAYETMALDAATSRVAAGHNYRSDAMQGLSIGRSVARAVLASREGDGWDRVWDGTGRIQGECNWEPTPPAFKYPPLEPLWGEVRPWLMSSGDQLRPPPPPACGSDEYVAAARDAYEASLTLTDRQKEIATYWAGNPGSETPPGMNLHIALDAAADHGLGTMRHARLMGYVGAVLADAGIASWDAKFAYWWDRPANTIRRLWDPSWTSYIPTPPFPGYISGHSTFSAAAMGVLEHFFPEDAVTFRSYATEAAISRFYGGIHVRYDNEVGLTVGGGVADLAVERAGNDRA